MFFWGKRCEGFGEAWGSWGMPWDTLGGSGEALGRLFAQNTIVRGVSVKKTLSFWCFLRSDIVKHMVCERSTSENHAFLRVFDLRSAQNTILRGVSVKKTSINWVFLRWHIVKHMVWESYFGPFWSIWALGSEVLKTPFSEGSASKRHR